MEANALSLGGDFGGAGKAEHFYFASKICFASQLRAGAGERQAATLTFHPSMRAHE